METQLRTHKADFIVKNYTAAAAAAGLVPAPLVNFALFAGLQLLMLRNLSNLYEVDFSDEQGRSAIAALVGGGVPVSISMNTVGMLSQQALLPLLVRGAVGTLVSPLFGAATTYAIGKVFSQHFETGGTFLTFEPQRIQAYYEAQLKTGQRLTQAGTVGNKKP